MVFTEREVFEFMFLPHQYLHNSWWEKIKDGDDLKKLSQHKRAEQSVSGIIMDTFELDKDSSFNINGDIDKIVLLPVDKITNLIVHIGLIFISPQIKSTILKKEILRFKEELGEERFLFAKKIAPAFLYKLGQENRTPPIPSETSILTCSYAIGLNVLGTAMKNTEESLKQRLILKLGEPTKNHLDVLDDKYSFFTEQDKCILLIKALLTYLKIEPRMVAE